MSSMIGAATTSTMTSKKASALMLGRSVAAEAPNDKVDPHHEADEKAGHSARQRSAEDRSDPRTDRCEQQVRREQKRSGSGHVPARQGRTAAGFLHWVC